MEICTVRLLFYVFNICKALLQLCEQLLLLTCKVNRVITHLVKCHICTTCLITVSYFSCNFVVHSVSQKKKLILIESFSSIFFSPMLTFGQGNGQISNPQIFNSPSEFLFCCPSCFLLWVMKTTPLAK
jgi:hypothetical protein